MYEKIVIIAFVVTLGYADKCVPRSFGDDAIVCVCNATYCDTADEPVLEPGMYSWYVSSKNGARLELATGNFSHQPECDTTLIVDPAKTYQKIIGFGTSFTDSAGMNVRNLSNETQEQLIRAYFGPEGSSYNLARVPIGGTDFSTHAYSLDDYPNDVNLEHFSLAPEDYEYKIPLLKEARTLSPDLKVFSATWSPPPWMKTNNNYSGIGFLKSDMYQVLANYILKFIDSYKQEGVDIWAVSTGNEPFSTFAVHFHLNTMGWTPGTMGAWVANNLGPTLKNSQYNDTIILALDDQRFELPWFIDDLFVNKKAKEYISGIAVHWYYDQIITPLVLDMTYERHPDKFLLYTEACTGSLPWEYHGVTLGSWQRGEYYILDIIENMNHWVSGWVDWNLALDKNGGPTYIDNYVDSPIIVNPETDEFFKQPMYYGLSHFSKFVPRGSVKIDMQDTTHIKTAAFHTPSEETVIVMYNRDNLPRRISIKDLKLKGHSFINLELPPYSMHTLMYKQ